MTALSSYQFATIKRGLDDNASIASKLSIAKSFKYSNIFRSGSPSKTLKGSERTRKRDRLKAFFSLSRSAPISDSDDYTLRPSEYDENSSNEGFGKFGNEESSDSEMQLTRTNTMCNRFLTEKTLSDSLRNSTRSQSILKFTSTNRISSRYIKEKIRQRLAKKTKTSNVSKETLFEIPPDITKTIASCVLDSRSFISTEESSLGDLEVKLDLDLEYHDPSSRNSESGRGRYENEAAGFTPRYQHAFKIAPPPKNLPKHLHAKWERSQMFKNTARTYDHEKWKSKQLLVEQENDSEKEDTKRITQNNSLTSIGNNSSRNPVSNNLFENVSKLFSLNNSSKTANSSPTSNKNFFNTSKLFSPATSTPSRKKLSKRINSIESITSSIYSKSTLSSSKTKADSPKTATILSNTKFARPDPYSLQDTFRGRNMNQAAYNTSKQLKDETFSEFSF